MINLILQLKFIDDITSNKSSYQFLKRNNIEKGLLSDKDNYTKKQILFSNQIYTIPLKTIQLSNEYLVKS